MIFRPSPFSHATTGHGACCAIQLLEVQPRTSNLSPNPVRTSESVFCLQASSGYTCRPMNIWVTQLSLLGLEVFSRASGLLFSQAKDRMFGSAVGTSCLQNWSEKVSSRGCSSSPLNQSRKLSPIQLLKEVCVHPHQAAMITTIRTLIIETTCAKVMSPGPSGTILGNPSLARRAARGAEEALTVQSAMG